MKIVIRCCIRDVFSFVTDSAMTGHHQARITAADLTAATAILNVAAQQPAVAGGVIKKQRRTGANRRADSKRGVTFKMGLIADKEIQEEYKGALMNFDEVCVQDFIVLDIPRMHLLVSI